MTIEQALEELGPTDVQPAQRALDPCAWCHGTGVDSRSVWAGLWGFNCWICSGWGAVKRGTLNMRGPLGGPPYR